MKKISVKVVIPLMALIVALTAGCAQVARKVDVLYSPLATYRGGSGSLIMATVDSPRDSGSGPAIRWVLGQIKNTDGVATGDIISSIRPQDLITDAFKQELTAAGYQPASAGKLDKLTQKGVAFTDISVHLEEVTSLSRLESSCTILLKMDLWKNGTAAKRTEYRSRVSDIAVIDREQLSSTLFQKAIQDIVQQAVPDIIRHLD